MKLRGNTGYDAVEAKPCTLTQVPVCPSNVQREKENTHSHKHNAADNQQQHDFQIKHQHHDTSAQQSW